MDNTLCCRSCGELIYFDREIVSEKSGKRIPLNRDTGEPHCCLSWKLRSAWRFYSCSKGCGELIYFDSRNEEGMSSNGKYVPLSKETGRRHQCQ